MFRFLIPGLLTFLYSCHEQERPTSSQLSFHKIGEIRFRRSYAHIQFRDVSTKELDSIRNSNPNAGNTGDDVELITLLQNHNIADNNGGLIRSSFISNSPKTFKLYSNNKKVTCHLIRSKNKNRYYYDLVILYDTIKHEIELEGQYGLPNEDIKYLLLDIKEGGFKEIIILNEYYIMNGDNSDIYIYEIKTNEK